MKKYVFSTLILLSLNAHADVYQGTIGTSKVFMQIDENCSASAMESNDCLSMYAYDSQLKDIFLGTKKINHQYQLNTEDAPVMQYDVDREVFLLTPTPTGLTGSWRRKEKTLTVRLSKITPDTISQLPALGNNTTTLSNDGGTYERLKLSKLVFEVIGSRHQFGNTIKWVKEKHSGITYPQLTGSNDQTINAVLRQRQSDSALGVLGDCSGDESVELFYLSAQLVSLSIFSESYCAGAAHPNSNTAGLLLNRKTGKQYALEDVIEFKKNAPSELNSEQNFDAFSQYRSEEFAPRLLSLVTANHFQTSPPWDSEVAKQEMMNDCEYSNAANWAFTNWVYTKQGIEFIPSYPHAAAVCSLSFLVKWSQLKPYLNPSFTLR